MVSTFRWAGFDLAEGARQSEPPIKIIDIHDLIWPDGSDWSASLSRVAC
jgi:hypothetical protein